MLALGACTASPGGPTRARRRLRLSGQMVDLARRLHEPELTLTALWTHKDALDSGDLALFSSGPRGYRRDAVAGGFALHQWWSATIGATGRRSSR